MTLRSALSSEFAAPSGPQPDHTVPVRTPSGAYDIHIGVGLLNHPSTFVGLPQAQHGVVVSNATVHALHGCALEDTLALRHPQLSRVLLPDGEAFKTWETLNQVFDHLLTHGCDRKTVLYALGGGVVGDITGFAAASYMRGVPFVQVPTTLLAQVDSSVGGKTAINHPLGKNMIGAFYQPARVVCDLNTLDSLPQRELCAGLAEVIKYGPIADLSFMSWLEDNLGALLARDRAALAQAVRRSCEIKAWVVAQDEREGGLRAILNFGHTFGHAIETGMGYGQWLHGEAVACGMVLAADLSATLGLVSHTFAQRVQRLVERAGLPVLAPAMPLPRWLELMRVDKKAEAGDVRYVLLAGPGQAAMHGVDDTTVQGVIARHSAPA
jgi:3-dehydroquinate synthase